MIRTSQEFTSWGERVFTDREGTKKTGEGRTRPERDEEDREGTKRAPGRDGTGVPGKNVKAPSPNKMKFGLLKIWFVVVFEHLRVRHARHRIAEKKLVCAISSKLKSIF